MPAVTTLVLASASPRRRELLALLGLPFDVRPADLDETPQPGEGASALVLRLARAKAAAVAAASPVTGRSAGPLVVLAADTVVALGDEVFGKPVDDADARRMLGALSGRTHRVLTGVALAVRAVGAPPTEARVLAEVVTTEVTMVVLPAAHIDWYVARGEPRDKAGAYAIQGRGGLFVDRIAGSWDNVVGLPLVATRRLLATVGIDPLAG